MFQFEDVKSKFQFNFKLYYEEDDQIEVEQLIKKVETKLHFLK